MLLILLSSAALAVLVAHGAFVLSTALPERRFLHFRIVFALLLPAQSVVFVRRLVASLDRVDDLAQSLEARVGLAAAKLRTSYEEQRPPKERRLSKQNATASCVTLNTSWVLLASIIAKSWFSETDTNRIERSGEAALDDLRLLIGSLSVVIDITGIPGSFRERAEQLLASQGLKLV